MIPHKKTGIELHKKGVSFIFFLFLQFILKKNYLSLDVDNKELKQ